MKITVKVKSDFEQQNNVSSDDFEDIISDLEKTGENLSERYLKEDTITEEEARELAFKYTPEGQEISKYGNTIENINNRAEGYIEAEERHEEQIAKENEAPNVEKLDLLSDEVTETIEEAKEHDKKKNKIPYRNYLILFIIITSLSACFTFSKYVSTVNTNSTSTVVAKFDVKVVSSSNLTVNSTKQDIYFDGYLNNTEYMGVIPTKSFTFTVTNDSEVPVHVVCSSTGNTNHTVYVSPNVVDLASGESEDITFKVKAVSTDYKTGKTDSDVYFNFKAEQID